MDPAALDTLTTAFSNAPWYGYVMAAVAVLSTLASALVTGCSIAARILDTKDAAGAFVFDYPRLRAVVDGIALNRPPPSP